MIDTAANGAHIIVMGDLCIDALIDCANLSPTALLSSVCETTFRSSNSLSVGGSAWLLACAAKATGFFHPIILTAIGDDIWADKLISTIRETGLPDESIQRIDSASTDLICMMIMPDQRRIMFMPEKSTNSCLEEDFTLNFLRKADHTLIRWTWISGYALINQGSARRRTARLLADWSKKKQIPVVLDLVPHEFSSTVGTLGEVVSFLGEPNVLIGAPSTFRDFGYFYSEDSDDRVKDVRDLAVRASQDLGIVITQTHIGPNRFGQVLAQHGTVISIDETVMPAQDVRGTGDRLAIEALHRLGQWSTHFRGVT